ncbi:MAG: hypothetical protein AAF517_10605 [Planctomycetota bacterium]
MIRPIALRQRSDDSFVRRETLLVVAVEKVEFVFPLTVTTGTKQDSRAKPSFWLTLCLVGSVILGVSSRAAAFTDEDRRFADYLIFELGYYDTAERYLDEVKSRGASGAVEAELEAKRIDLLRAKGDKAGAEKAMADFKRKFPNHSSAALGQLETGASAFESVARQLEKASTLPDPNKRAALLSKAAKEFEQQVRVPLDGNIKALDAKVEGDDEMRRRRNLAELSRIRFLLLYSNLLPEKSTARKTALERGLAHAGDFVEDRGYFYVMQYEALIQKGMFLLELERFDEAGEELAVLFDIEPSAPPPYAPAILKAFKTLRLKAVLFGARGFNGAGNHREARQVIKDILSLPKSNPFNLRGAMSDPDLRRFAVLLQLENGIALAGDGEAQKGLSVIHKVIDEQTKLGDRGLALVIDARQALSKVAAGGTVQLSGRDYYEAAIGLKSQRRLSAALTMFQRALSSLSSRYARDYAPRCLNEIGELLFIEGRFVESASAFRDVCLYFRSHEIAQKSATNLVAAASKCQSLYGPGHAGIEALQAEAKRLYDQSGGGGGETVFQAQMAAADREINDGKYAAARKIYDEIPQKTSKGQKVSFYWRAHFSAWWMLVLQYESATDDAAKQQAATEFPAAIADLSKNINTALSDGDRLGAAVGSLALGQIYYNQEKHAEAVQALKIFLGELADDRFVACGALGYLVESAVATDDEAAASAAFKLLDKKCQDDPARGSAALAMSNFFTTSSAPKAAYFMYVYAQSDVFEQFLTGVEKSERADTFLNVARVLYAGGMISEAQQFVEKAEASASKGDLERQLLYLRAIGLNQRKDYKGVIKNLEKYVKAYKAQGDKEEDPDVWHSLGLAYYNVNKKKTSANLAKADEALNAARTLTFQRFKITKDRVLEKRYWKWAYQWMRVKYVRGTKAGAKDALKEIKLFVTESEGTGGEMGGYRDRFLKLREKAVSALKRRR